MAAGDPGPLRHLGASVLRPAVGLPVDLIRDPTGQSHPYCKSTRRHVTSSGNITSYKITKHIFSTRAKEQGALSPPTGDSRGTQELMAAGDSHLGASGLRPAVGLLVDLIRDTTEPYAKRIQSWGIVLFTMV